jgi:hypothetical protein
MQKKTNTSLEEFWWRNIDEGFADHDREERHDENEMKNTIIFQHLFARLTIIFCE